MLVRLSQKELMVVDVANRAERELAEACRVANLMKAEPQTALAAGYLELLDRELKNALANAVRCQEIARGVTRLSAAIHCTDFNSHRFTQEVPETEGLDILRHAPERRVIERA
jgi:hypothetical protein